MTKRREISPVENMSADEFLKLMPTQYSGIVATIRAEKDADERTKPSDTFVDLSNVMTHERRAALLDKVAELVDENLAGRGEMCIQYAGLMVLALEHLGIQCTGVSGIAKYYDATGHEIHRWMHAWVRIGNEVIDGNTDSIVENPTVPENVKAAPYWGPIREVPDRRLTAQGDLDMDSDVTDTWWPDLKKWLDENFAAIAS